MWDSDKLYLKRLAALLQNVLTPPGLETTVKYMFLEYNFKANFSVFGFPRSWKLSFSRNVPKVTSRPIVS